MPKFRTLGPRMIYGRGHRIYFDDDGYYETHDEREVKFLRGFRRVEEVGTKGSPEVSERVVRSKESASGPSVKVTMRSAGVVIPGKPVDPSKYTRAQLDQIARAAGVDNPEGYDTKGHLADAINNLRA